MKKLWADMTPVEKMRQRGESIIRMHDGTHKRRAVHEGREPLNCYILVDGEKIRVRQVSPPGYTRRGLPIEWEEA